MTRHTARTPRADKPLPVQKQRTDEAVERGVLSDAQVDRVAAILRPYRQLMAEARARQDSA